MISIGHYHDHRWCFLVVKVAIKIEIINRLSSVRVSKQHLQRRDKVFRSMTFKMPKAPLLMQILLNSSYQLPTIWLFEFQQWTWKISYVVSKCLGVKNLLPVWSVELRWLRQEFHFGLVSLRGKKLTISFYLNLKATRQRREIKTFALAGTLLEVTSRRYRPLLLLFQLP